MKATKLSDKMCGMPRSLWVCAVLCLGAPAQDTARSEALQKLLDEALREAIREESWDPQKVSVTLIDVQNRTRASYRGDVAYYPASVVKMVYMIAAFDMVRVDEEVMKELQQMMGPSSNVACGKIVDRITGTRSGSALGPREYADFAFRRGTVNRWLRKLGLKNINAIQKTWDDQIPPSDLQLLRNGKTEGPFTNRNSMTTDDTATLLYWLATGKFRDTEKMLSLMARDLKTYPDDRNRALGGVPEGSKVWAKVGWVSKEHHEAALIELPDGRRFVQVVFTNADNYTGPFIARVTRQICRRLVK